MNKKVKLRILSLLCATVLMATACTAKPVEPNESSIESSTITESGVSSEEPAIQKEKLPAIKEGEFDILAISKHLTVNDKPVSLPCTVSELGGNFEILEKHEKLNVKAMEPTTYVSKLVDNDTYTGDTNGIAAIFVGDVSKTDTDLSQKPIVGISTRKNRRGDPTNNAIETLKVNGIGVGSTREEIIEKFGEPKDSNHPLGIGDKGYFVMGYRDENGYMAFAMDNHDESEFYRTVDYVTIELYDKDEKNDPALEGVMYTIYDVLKSVKVDGKEVGFPFPFEELKKLNLTDEFTLYEYSLAELNYDYFYGLGRVGVVYDPKFVDESDYDYKKDLDFCFIDLDKSYENLKDSDENKYTNSQVGTFSIRKESQEYNPMSVDIIKIGDTREVVEGKLGKSYNLSNRPFDNKGHRMTYSDGTSSISIYFDDNNLVDAILCGIF